MSKHAALSQGIAFVDEAGGGPVLVHSDLLNAPRITTRSARRSELLTAHMNRLLSLISERPIWMPTFNYSFTDTGRYDVRHDPSQVGVLTEHFRQKVAKWRTPIPVFSFAGLGEPPTTRMDGEIDPFDASSGFAQLASRDGSVMFYGAPFSSATILHYAERLSGGPLYRYDKRFRGTVTTQEGHGHAVTLLYHVRPLPSIDYDWDRLLADAIGTGACHVSEDAKVVVAPAKHLTDYWIDRMRDDPLYLLNSSSRIWVEAHLERVGRRFTQADFEEDSASFA